LISLRNLWSNGKTQPAVTSSKDIMRILNVGLSLFNSMLCTLDANYGRKVSEIIRNNFFTLRDLLMLIGTFLDRL
jgi:hypothetical protein